MEDHCYTVYCHTNKVNGKKYIGITRKKPEYRWNYGHGYKNQTHFYNAIVKYGWDNFDHEILLSGLTKEEAEAKEIDLVKQFNTQNRDFGYNISCGGRCGRRYATEEEAIAAKRETQRKSREKNRDKRLAESKAWRQANRDRVNKSKREYYHRTKVLKGCRQPLSDETKVKIGLANSRKVIALLDGEPYMEFSSFTEAEKALGVNHSNICRSIRTGIKCGGFNWMHSKGGGEAVNY